jgi:hypothetical protein
VLKEGPKLVSNDLLITDTIAKQLLAFPAGRLEQRDVKLNPDVSVRSRDHAPMFVVNAPLHAMTDAACGGLV